MFLLISLFITINTGYANPFKNGHHRPTPLCSKRETREVKKIESKIDNLTKSVETINVLEKELEHLQNDLELIDNLKQHKFAAVWMLDELAQNCPNTVQLISIQEQNNLLNIAGVAASNADISRFLTELEQSNYFQEVYLNSIEQIKQDDTPLKAFSLSSQFFIPSTHSTKLIPMQSKQSELPNNTHCEPLKSARTNLDLIESRVARINHTQAEITKRTTQISSKKEEFITSTEVPELLRTIATHGRKSGLQISNFHPKNEIIISKTLAEIPFQLTLEGTYHEMAYFFDIIARVDHILNIKNIDLTILQEDISQVKLYCELTISAYRWIDSEEKRADSAEESNRAVIQH